jgi:hypothetical protein
MPREEYIMMYRELLSAAVKESLVENPAGKDADQEIDYGDEAEETEGELAEAE